MPPSTPRRIWRPTSRPTVRAACLAIASTMPCRRLLPHNRSFEAAAELRPGSNGGRQARGALDRGRLGPVHVRGSASAGNAAAPPAPPCREPSVARRIRPRLAIQDLVGGFAVDGACRTCAPTGLPARTCARSASVIAPMRQRGGAISVRSTGIGTPLSCSIDTSASPTPSCEIAFATSSFGLGTKVSAAVLHRLLVARGERAQRVLHAVAELAEDVVGHVVGELRAEIDADALGADQAHDLFDALLQRRRRIVEQQVRLVEHEHQLRLVEVADLRQLLEQLRQQPQQEARIQPRLQDQLVGGEDADRCRGRRASVRIRSASSSAGSPKKRVAALLLRACSSARWIARDRRAR